MAAEYILITDSACDITPEKLREWNVELVRMPFLFTDDGKEHLDHDLSMPEFYAQMRDGRVAKTSGVNQDTFENAFTPFLEAGKDVFYLAFSSGLTKQYSSQNSTNKDNKRCDDNSSNSSSR